MVWSRSSVAASIVPVYPDAFTIPSTLIEALRRQLPNPLPSKFATSAEPGTDAPPLPPEDVDQLAVSFQFAADPAIQ